MMHKIAIIQVEKNYNRFDDYTRIVSSITDWTEVSTEDLKLLRRAEGRKNFTVIEQPLDQNDFIARTVAEAIEIEIKEAKQRDLAGIDRKQRAINRRAKVIERKIR